MAKQMKIWDNPEELRQELQRIADELGLPINDERVFGAWVGDGKSFTPEIHEKVTKPLYFSNRQKKDTSFKSSS